MENLLNHPSIPWRQLRILEDNLIRLYSYSKYILYPKECTFLPFLFGTLQRIFKVYLPGNI
jgi:uncharacterized protein with HEPN domain